MSTFTDDHQCFVCGQENPVGLKLQFQREGGSAETEVVFPAYLQGWKEVVHGGALATVLDEVMVQAAMGSGITCVTAEITVSYRKPARVGASYRASGRVVETKGRIIKVEGEILGADGVVCAQATGKLFRTE